MGNRKARVHLRQIAVANRCTEDWEGMRGDGATRFCGKCRQNVYNLSMMTEEQADELLARSEHTCVRYAYRADGTIVTSACAPSSRRAVPVLAAGVAGALTYSAAFVGVSAAVDAPPSQAAVETAPVQVAMGMKLVVKVPGKRRSAPASDAAKDLGPSAAPSAPVVSTPVASTPIARTPTQDGAPWWKLVASTLLLLATFGLSRRFVVGHGRES